jgi:hypothetical protein
VNTEIPHDLEVGKMLVEDTTESSSTSATDTSHDVFEIFSSSIAYAAARRRDLRSNIDGFNRKRSGQTAPATTPSSSVTTKNSTPYPSKANSTVTATAESTRTDKPDDHDPDVEVGGGPSSLASDAPAASGRGFCINDFHRKRSRETASATAPSTSVTPDA